MRKKSSSSDLVVSVPVMLAISLYIAFQIFSDIMAIKITSVWGLIIPTAVFIYPLTFTLRDVVHKDTDILSKAHDYKRNDIESGLAYMRFEEYLTKLWEKRGIIWE